MDSTKVSKKLLNRLPGYLNHLRSLPPETQNISAAAILGMLPLVIIYCCMQKYFIEGVSAGGVKE